MQRRDLDRTTTIGALAVAAIATLAVAAVPPLRFAYPASTLKVALETASALVAALVGYLVVGRFLLDRRIDRAIVAYGMFALASSNVLLITLPRILDHGETELRIATWLPLGCHLVGAAALAAAASHRFDNQFAPPHVRSRLWLALLPVAVIAGVAVVAHLPIATEQSVPLATAARPQLQRDVLVAAVQLFTGGLLAIATVSFLRRAGQFKDGFAMWLALGTGLSAIARVNFALFPSLFSQWLYTGDVILLLGYAAWLVGAAVEVSSYWEARANYAVTEERRRLARELHDGLAQELAFIASETRSWAPDARQQLVASAAERALDESRRAISALVMSSDQEFGAVLRRTLEAVADRYRCALSVFVSPSVEIAPSDGEELVRISREAAVNACRHGHARSVSVIVDRVDAVHRLVVRDDGSGFEPTAANGTESHGLHSIRDRARSIGGEATIRSQLDRGTEVDVRW